MKSTCTHPMWSCWLVLCAFSARVCLPLCQRLLNIHPSAAEISRLHTHRQALENGDEEHGTSVHFVTDELDGGPVILQAKVPVFAGDTEDDITARVQTREHAIYPLVISWFADGRLKMHENAAWLDGQRLPPQGYAADE